ncbi:MAG: VTC domain-containing protein [Verrucomicrobia bacterium]|nr:VTC domain-containing protein [Kiritimatiellia bacterium]MCO6401034.1 VTC domain-containing protein [Verrucomicrobiota bacterium]
MTIPNPILDEPILTNERKLIASASRAERAIQLLDQLLLPDGDYPENTIHSIYYETRSLRSFAEKVDGDNLKHKVRLRWYRDNRGAAESNEIPAFLEVKFRIGSARHKIRQKLSLNRQWLASAPLTDPALGDVLRMANAELGAWMSDSRIPAIHISYQRCRYRCPYTEGRVAVDRNIRVHRFHPDLFPFGAPFSIADTVCEYKDAAQVEIPWLRHLYDAGFRMRSYSKFGEAIRILSLGGAPA